MAELLMEYKMSSELKMEEVTTYKTIRLIYVFVNKKKEFSRLSNFFETFMIKFLFHIFI